ncbi:hypothetical protein OAU50_02375 [Planctomycetota bacterium]|nr:hypothetical protein [Planctomycetota bacterium]
MNRRHVTVLLALCLLVAGLCGWWLTQTDEVADVGPANQVATTDDADAINSAINTLEFSGKEIAEGTGDSETPPIVGDTDNPIPEDHWRLSGRIVPDFSLKHAMFQNPNLPHWFISFETLPVNDGKLETEWTDDFEIAADGCFSVDVPKDDFSTLEGFWRFDVRIEEDGHPLEGHAIGLDFGDWSDDDGIVDMAKVLNLINPSVSGNHADFGDIKVNLSHFVYDSEQFVYGRVMHTSGQPFANASNLVLCAKEMSPGSDEIPLDYDEVAWIDTDENGWFVGLIEDVEFFTALNSPQHFLTSEEGLDGFDDVIMNSEYTWRTDAPQQHGKTWDYGTITIDGCMVIVEVTGVREGAVVEGIFMDFASGDLWYDKYLSAKGGCCILPAARYRWSADIEATNALFEYCTGILDVTAGTTTTLTIKAKELDCVVVHVERADGQKLEEYWFDEGDDGWCHRWNTGPLFVEFDGPTLDIEFKADGYKTRSLTLTKGSKPIHVIMKAASMISVTVVFPALPAELKEKKHSLNVNLVVFTDSDDYSDSVAYLSMGMNVNSMSSTLTAKPNKQWIEIQEAGLYRFVLTGSEEWGYESLGSKEIRLTHGQEHTVTFDALPPPPFEFRSGGIHTSAYIDEHRVAVFAQAKQVGGEIISIHIDDDDGDTDDRFPWSIKDGDRFIEPEITPIAKDDDKTVVRFILPHRVSVTCSVRGNPTREFAAAGHYDDGNLGSSCDAIGGIAKLWLPEGEAEVSAFWNDTYKTKTVKIRRGQIASVHFDFVSCEVKFTTRKGWDAQWPLFESNPDGKVVKVHFVIPGESLSLEPGKYFTHSPNGSVRKELVIKPEDSTLTFALPNDPEDSSTGYVMLTVKLPVDATTSDIAFSFRWVVITGDSIIDTNVDRLTHSLNIIETPEGLRLSGIPIGVKVCLFGGIETWDQKHDDRQWMMKPIILTLARSGETIAGELLKTATDGELWYEYDARLLSFAEGLPMDLWHGLPIGRHEYGFYENGKLVLREWITIPADTKDSFDLPEDILTRLKQLTKSD